MSHFNFTFLLGDAVQLDCVVTFTCEELDRNSLKVYAYGVPFDCEDILLDTDGDFVSLSRYLLTFALQEHQKWQSTINQAKKPSRTS